MIGMWLAFSYIVVTFGGLLFWAHWIMYSYPPTNFWHYSLSVISILLYGLLVGILLNTNLKYRKAIAARKK